MKWNRTKQTERSSIDLAWAMAVIYLSPTDLSITTNMKRQHIDRLPLCPVFSPRPCHSVGSTDNVAIVHSTRTNRHRAQVPIAQRNSSTTGLGGRTASANARFSITAAPKVFPRLCWTRFMRGFSTVIALTRKEFREKKMPRDIDSHNKW
ncbi:hypothetical protein BDW62DRAFT_61273 [Aspergillus aurantiobrunneus]